MFDNIVVGVDGLQGGRDAIALATKLADPEAKLTLAHVYGGRTMGGRASAMAMPLELESARQLLTRTLSEAGLEADTELVESSSVGRGLHELADRMRADLLVVGSTRRALLGRALLGDDSRTALNGAPCAIAIASRAYAQAPQQPLRLGVGYDDSPESVRALSAARALAARYGSTIQVLWVIALPRVQEETPIPADWDATIKKLTEEYSARLAELGDVEGRVTYGGPREELTQFGKALDLLIVGSRNYGPLGRLVHGSVSGYLLGHAACSLLVLPRTGADEEPSRRG